MTKIKDIKGREILDSRGNPTVEVEIVLENNLKAIASVASGASTGSYEALELRDNDKNRFDGKGVLTAVSNINNIIKPHLIGKDCENQEEIDKLLIKIDGTENKTNLGANAILGVSLANLKAAALANNLELYEYLGKLYHNDKYTMPRPMMNILNGGVHASNKLDIQEFMIIPMSNDYLTNLRMGVEIFHNLKTILKDKNLLSGVGDEGGFAPNINTTYEALDLIKEAVALTGYKLGKDVNLGLDVAASEFYRDGYYYFEGKKLTTNEMINFYEDLIEKYPIISIEDPLDENDYDGFKLMTEKFPNLQIVGDDLFVTNIKLLKKGIDEKFANAILIKLNQIGTVTETIETINLAKANNYKTIISHRSGETEDTYIADFAVGLNLGQIKTGSLSRTDRTCKYNRLIRINEEIKN